MLVFATMIGLVAFAVGVVLGFVIILVANDPALPHPLITCAISGGMWAGTAFVAALLLCARDRARHAATIANVRQTLLARPNVTAAEFCGHFADADPVLVTQTREAISQFFHVPPEKIHPADDLHADFRFGSLEPSFHTFVVLRVLEIRNMTPQPFLFNTGDLANVGDLVTEIRRVLDGFEDARPGDDPVK